MGKIHWHANTTQKAYRGQEEDTDREAAKDARETVAQRHTDVLVPSLIPAVWMDSSWVMSPLFSKIRPLYVCKEQDLTRWKKQHHWKAETPPGTD